MDTTNTLNHLLKKYEKEQKPISVNFRRLVSCLHSPERYTHLVHPYPAKLLMHIPHFFLSNKILSKPGDIVLDPFAGSGTVLLEALILGRKAIGADSNPLARLISRVKTTHIPPQYLNSYLDDLLDSIPSKPASEPPNVVNIHKWFHPHVIKSLQCLYETLINMDDSDIKNFFLICFSASIRKVSLADPKLSVPVFLREEKYPQGHKFRGKIELHLKKLKTINVIDIFREVSEKNIKRMATIDDSILNENVFLCNDARNIKFNDGKSTHQVPDESVSLIITSPPYAGAQKYIRSLSLSLGWLGFCNNIDIKDYKKLSIGREDYRKSDYCDLLSTQIDVADSLLKSIYSQNPLRAHIAANYLNEMRTALLEAKRVLKRRGYFVLVMANNQVCGQEFKTASYIETIAHQLGFTTKLRLIDNIKSWGLMTKRNKTASTITCEWVYIFKKG